MYITVDMGLGKGGQLSAHVLGCILIARGAEVEQKQMQRFLESVGSVNILLPSPQLAA